MKKIINNKKMILFVIAFLSLIFLLFLNRNNEIIEISYNDFLTKLENNEIKEVSITNKDKINFIVNDDLKKYVTDNPRKSDFKEILLLKGVTVKEQEFSFSNSLNTIITIGLFAFVFTFVLKSQTKSKNESLVTIDSNDEKSENKKLTFSDMAGNEEAKESVSDIIDFIKNPEKYSEYGARMPKGLIFYGPPGTGKTLMAKALAGEAGVPFYAVSGSDFVQKYVGVGAGRIRDLFKKAREVQKAVIFIDEIDALGKKRSGEQSGGNDERDQTLNALLTEMSGFNSKEGIIVIAATNRLDILDEALLRPGRFDRQIEIGLPDLKARLSIINHYANGKPLEKNIDLLEIAKQTVYFSGAMIENLLNEASIIAAKNQMGYITTNDIDKAYYTVLAGAEKKDRSSISQKDRMITSFHESGHALITKLLLPENSVAKVTIIPSSKGIGGFSLNIPPDKMYFSKKEMEYQIMVSFAGRAAEEIKFGKEFVTTGAANDIEKATQIIKDYVSKYGMSENTGLLNSNFFRNDKEVMTECKDQLDVLYKKTLELLNENFNILEKISFALLEKETLNEEDLNILIA